MPVGRRGVDDAESEEGGVDGQECCQHDSRCGHLRCELRAAKYDGNRELDQEMSAEATGQSRWSLW